MESPSVSAPWEQALMARAGAIRELAAHVHAAEARLATMLSEFTADGMWNQTGDWRPLAHWLGLNCGDTGSEAIAMQRVVEAVDVMPTVMAHASRGEVSLQVAAQAALVATPHNDEELAREVTAATPGQAARVFAEYRKAERRAAAEAAEAAAGDAGEGDDEEQGAVDSGAFWRSWFDAAEETPVVQRGRRWFGASPRRARCRCCVTSEASRCGWEIRCGWPAGTSVERCGSETADAPCPDATPTDTYMRITSSTLRPGRPISTTW